MVIPLYYILPWNWLILMYSIEPDHVTGNAELEEKARLTMKTNFRSSVSIVSNGCIMSGYGPKGPSVQSLS